MNLSAELVNYHLTNLYQGFLATDIPDPTEREAPEGMDTYVNQVLGFVAWAGTAAGVLGVLITGVMMAVSHKRGESSEHMSRLGMVLGGCILVATAGPIVQFVFDAG